MRFRYFFAGIVVGVVLSSTIFFLPFHDSKPRSADQGDGELAEWTTVAGTFDVDDEVAIVSLLRQNQIPVNSGGEFGIWFSVPPSISEHAKNVLRTNGYSDYIWNQIVDSANSF